MKVKILKGTNIQRLEREVNEFIEDKCIINISHEIVTSKMCDRCINTLLIIILYDEYNHCGYLNADLIKNLRSKETN